MKQLLIIISLFTSATTLAGDTVFSKLNVDEPVCYGREYSADHLKSHGDQTVQKIQSKLQRRSSEYGESKILELEVTLKGDAKKYTNYRAYFICYDDSNVCAIECDGGSVNVTINKNGNLILENKGFVLEGGCGGMEEQEPQFLTSSKGGDDIFEMVPLPKEYCQNTPEE